MITSKILEAAAAEERLKTIFRQTLQLDALSDDNAKEAMELVCKIRHSDAARMQRYGVGYAFKDENCHCFFKIYEHDLKSDQICFLFDRKEFSDDVKWRFVNFKTLRFFVDPVKFGLSSETRAKRKIEAARLEYLIANAFTFAGPGDNGLEDMWPYLHEIEALLKSAGNGDENEDYCHRFGGLFDGYGREYYCELDEHIFANACGDRRLTFRHCSMGGRTVTVSYDYKEKIKGEENE